MNELESIDATVRTALEEDVGNGDLTAALVASGQTATGMVICREPMVVAGRPWFDRAFSLFDDRVRVEWLVDEGSACDANTELCRIQGDARSLLTVERSALNFLQTLSGVATQTRHYVTAVKGTGASILDTRKTIPGLRHALKYAVRCGGGENHRIGLYDAYLIKENHIAACGSLSLAIETARATGNGCPVMAEVENLDELVEAIDAAADVILVDNFDLPMMRKAVKIRDEKNARCLIEASGNIDLQNVRSVAVTGVDRISIGAITKHVTAIDLSMRLSG